MPDLFTQTRPAAPTVTLLRQRLHLLQGRDRETAQSLLAQSGRLLSEKQMALAASLAARAVAAPAVKTEGLGSIVEMLRAAGVELKWPVVRFQAGDIRFRLGLSGAQSREPGSINVTSDEKAFADRTYFGRINVLGAFEAHRGQSDKAAAIGAALLAFAAAPAEQARLYGQRFGRCCFCGLELTERVSLEMGYGPICADRYGLPH